MNTSQLAEKYPNAYNALPECYREDDCLFFWMEDEVLWSKASEGQQFALDNFRSFFDPEIPAWVVDSWSSTAYDDVNPCHHCNVESVVDSDYSQCNDCGQIVDLRG